MQKYADPLGIERLIKTAEERLSADAPTQDQYEDWHSHPITIRLKQEIAIEHYKRNQEHFNPFNPELTALAEQVISYGLAGGGKND